MSTADELARVVRARGVRVAVAESLTSGMLASQVGSGEGSSEWFAGGIVAYGTDVKERVLGLTPGTDPCSAECATQLARGTRDLLQADVVVATTGIGGPDPVEGHAPGTVYLGWAAPSGDGAMRMQLEGDPTAVLRATSDAALDLLVRLASGEPPRPDALSRSRDA